MIIYIVKAGDTIYSIAKRYGVNPVHLMADNGLKAEDILVVGQAVVIQIPEKVYTVRQGDTLYSIAKATGISMRQIYRNNLWLKGQALLRRGSTIVLQYQEQWTKGNIMTNSYAYPYINVELLRPQLPFLSWFTPFTYGINTDGGLVQLEDETLLRLAKTYAARPLMHLSTLTEQGGFSNDRASMIFNDTEKQEKLIREIIQTLQEKNYKGLDVDFEFIYPEERYDYITFLQNLRLYLNPMGYPVFSALAPKTSDTQRGVLYEGHDYAGIGAAANMVLLMTYEWGYTYGPPMVQETPLSILAHNSEKSKMLC